MTLLELLLGCIIIIIREMILDCQALPSPLVENLSIDYCVLAPNLANLASISNKLTIFDLKRKSNLTKEAETPISEVQFLSDIVFVLFQNKKVIAYDVTNFEELYSVDRVEVMYVNEEHSLHVFVREGEMCVHKRNGQMDMISLQNEVKRNKGISFVSAVAEGNLSQNRIHLYLLNDKYLEVIDLKGLKSIAVLPLKMPFLKVIKTDTSVRLLDSKLNLYDVQTSSLTIGAPSSTIPDALFLTQKFEQHNILFVQQGGILAIYCCSKQIFCDVFFNQDKIETIRRYNAGLQVGVYRYGYSQGTGLFMYNRGKNIESVKLTDSCIKQEPIEKKEGRKIKVMQRESKTIKPSQEPVTRVEEKPAIRVEGKLFPEVQEKSIMQMEANPIETKQKEENLKSQVKGQAGNLNKSELQKSAGDLKQSPAPPASKSPTPANLPIPFPLPPYNSTSTIRPTNPVAPSNTKFPNNNLGKPNTLHCPLLPPDNVFMKYKEKQMKEFKHNKESSPSPPQPYRKVSNPKQQPSSQPHSKPSKMIEVDKEQSSDEESAHPSSSLQSTLQSERRLLHSQAHHDFFNKLNHTFKSNLNKFKSFVQSQDKKLDKIITSATVSFKDEIHKHTFQSSKSQMVEFISTELHQKLQRYFQEVFLKVNSTYEAGHKYSEQRYRLQKEKYSTFEAELVDKRLEPLSQLIQGIKEFLSDKPKTDEISKFEEKIQELSEVLKVSTAAYTASTLSREKVDQQLEDKLAEMHKLLSSQESRLSQKEEVKETTQPRKFYILKKKE